MGILLVEPAIVPETYVSGLSHIELIGGGCMRFVCYVNVVGDEGAVLKVPRVSIIMPSAEVPDAILKAMKATGAGIFGTVSALFPQLIH